MSNLPPECQQLLISGYVLGNLSPTEALLFEEILKENPDLIEQVAQMQQAIESAYSPQEIAPPPGLRDRLLATANSQQTATATPSAPVKDSEVVSAPPSQFSWSKILGAIAIAIIATLGIVNYRLWQTVQSTKIINTKSETLTYLLGNEEATAKLIVKPEGLSATLTVTNLPPLPPNKVYALWTVVGKDVPYTTDEKGAILTAVFQASDNFTQEIAVP
ncbi:MAG: anti-sigma factor, partial [Cyanobacteria bacterium J06558_2]